MIRADFAQCLSKLKCDVLLIFGKDDPWCKPALAKKMLIALETREPKKVQRYVELENVGHCPNHEAPQAVSRVVSAWVEADNRDENNLQLANAQGEVLIEPWGEIVMKELKKEEIQLSMIDKITAYLV